MSPAETGAFLTAFIAGPLLYAALLRMGQGVGALVVLAAGAVLSAGAALLLQAQGRGLASLTLLWLGWILAVALCAVALRRRLPKGRGRRWATILGALATPLPWFGLATAQMLTF